MAVTVKEQPAKDWIERERVLEVDLRPPSREVFRPKLPLDDLCGWWHRGHSRMELEESWTTDRVGNFLGTSWATVWGTFWGGLLERPRDLLERVLEVDHF